LRQSDENLPVRNGGEKRRALKVNQGAKQERGAIRKSCGKDEKYIGVEKSYTAEMERRGIDSAGDGGMRSLHVREIRRIRGNYGRDKATR